MDSMYYALFSQPDRSIILSYIIETIKLKRVLSCNQMILYIRIVDELQW